ncbi:MAG: PIG-L family deacetylase [Planctomycetia bacterium]|nr:PIG-L family deacetylase [Planctomycetia bacterium]
MRNAFLFSFTCFLFLSSVSTAGDAVLKAENKLRIIVFGAHPDDAEYKAGGTAAKWAKLGHHVKLVSVTNGDIGHWKMAGGPLALRRKAEVKAAAKILGVTSEVLDIHDGELLPTLENRKTITRLIREWNADIVIAHRPWDYHPDHRYVGVLVQDAAFMVTVPFFCPDVAPLKKNPVFLYSSDGFQKPYPFVPDVAVSVDDVNPVARKAWLKENWSRRQSAEASRHRELLVRLYGEEAGRAVKYAETFELCEYGSRPNRDELKRLFPFFDK